MPHSFETKAFGEILTKAELIKIYENAIENQKLRHKEEMKRLKEELEKAYAMPDDEAGGENEYENHN